MREKYQALLDAVVDAAVNGATVFLLVWAMRYQGGTGFVEAVQLAAPLAVIRFVSYLREKTDWITLPQLDGSGSRGRSGRVRLGKFI